MRTGQTLSEPAKTFTAESGMVNLPYYHSFVHVDHFLLFPRVVLTNTHFTLNLPAALKIKPVSGKADVTIGTATAELL